MEIERGIHFSTKWLILLLNRQLRRLDSEPLEKLSRLSLLQADRLSFLNDSLIHLTYYLYTGEETCPLFSLYGNEPADRPPCHFEINKRQLHIIKSVRLGAYVMVKLKEANVIAQENNSVGIGCSYSNLNCFKFL
jgi:hypothetical protein